MYYILFERASEKECFNGIRDRGRAGMTFADFMKLKEVLEANLSEAYVLGLRFYTSHAFHAINRALRARHIPHPLPAIVMCINEGLKALRTLDADSDEATSVIEFYRGFTDTTVTDEFKEKGGSEFCPYSLQTCSTVF